jgi:hypothetical protein
MMCVVAGCFFGGRSMNDRSKMMECAENQPLYFLTVVGSEKIKTKVSFGEIKGNLPIISVERNDAVGDAFPVTWGVVGGYGWRYRIFIFTILLFIWV